MQHVDIGFIGAGNMARSLLGGLLAQRYPKERLWTSDPDSGQRELATALGVGHVSADNEEIVAHCAVVVVAVKPQMARQALAPLKEAVATSKPLVISIAAGIELAALESWLGAQRIVRCMPNTPALVSQGVTAMLANAHVTDVDRVLAESIMGAVGQWLWLEQESQLDAVTALSGSGPAYFFYFLEAMIEAGCELGLSEGDARTLALQTALGSSKMALQSDLAPDALRLQVTSPGGTTERALAVLRNGGFSPLVKAAIKAAEERARELARDFGSQ